MYFVLGISLTLALFLIANLAVATLAALFWRCLCIFVPELPAQTRSQLAFTLRILPVAISLALVTGFVVPAYVRHEPESSGEEVSVKMAAIAFASLLGAFIAAYRVVGASVKTRLLASNWLGGATEIVLKGVDIPLYRISHPFPVVAVIGIFRPRIFIAGQVWDILDDAELKAAVAHEYAHVRSCDNLKRTLLHICRDLLIVPVGQTLDRAWLESAEELADTYAARLTRSAALDLASALVKIGRVIPDKATPFMPAGAYVIDARAGDITTRVRKLVRLGQAAESPQVEPLVFPSAIWLLPAPLTSLLILPLLDHRFLKSTHHGIEAFVRFLQ